MHEPVILEESQPPTFARRFFVMCCALFLIFLTLSFLLPADVLSIFEGRLESYTLDDTLSVHTDFGIVQFSPEVYMTLQDLYFRDEVPEFAACLFGGVNGETYTIDQMYVPHMSEQSVSHVRFEACLPETLIVLHRHPFKRCLFSQQDVATHTEMKKRNTLALSAVMCEPRRFAFLS